MFDMQFNCQFILNNLAARLATVLQADGDTSGTPDTADAAADVMRAIPPA